MIAFAGFNTTSQTKYTFNDDVSILQTASTDTDDFCGEKQLVFSLNGTVTTLLSATNSDFVHFNPPSDTKDLGLGLATV